MKIEYRLMDKLGKLKQETDKKLARHVNKTNPTQLTFVQVTVLQYIIVESRKRDVFCKDLELSFGIKSSSVTSMVNYLEKAGYIRRETVAEDGRLRRLVITDKTREIEDWVCSVIDEYIVTTFDGMSEQNMEKLEMLLDELLQNVQKDR